LVRYCEATSSEFFMAVKDALYCDAPDSAHRRQAQYVLQLQLRVLARLFAPLLPFTAEEVFQALRTVGVEAADSVLLTTWNEVFADVQAQAVELPHYRELCDLRSNVHAHVERERAQGLKSAAQLDLRLLTPQSAQLEPLAQALRYWFGCAHLCVQASSAWAVEPILTSWKLCPRCRSHQPGTWEDLCPRCASAEAVLQAHAVQCSAPANVVEG
jgi:isoleucyl-tRNA synthetase